MSITPKISGIYAITHNASCKIYVGQSTNISKRVYQHQHNFSRKSCLYNAIQKYGWSAFTLTILEYIDDPNLLNGREQYWINTLDTNNRDKGYNIRLLVYSNRGIRMSAETRAKISAATTGKPHSPEAIAKMSAAKKGKKNSAEHIAHMRIANLGKLHTSETKAKMSAKRLANIAAMKLIPENQGKAFSPETLEKLRNANIGHPHSPERVANLIMAQQKRYHTAERTERILNYLSLNPQANLTQIALAVGCVPATAGKNLIRAGMKRDKNGFWIVAI